jgi:hypothetical protein
MSLPRWTGVVVAIAVAVVGGAPRRAQAFCGFFVAGSDAKLTNNASQVVLMRKGNRTVMTMSNSYQGPRENFAMVVPVPVVLHKGDVKTLPADVFDRIDSYIIRHYWEKPVACKDPRYDQWGGPPGVPLGQNKATPAKGLATAPRGTVVLRDEVRSPVPLLGIAGKPPHRRKAAEK